MILSPHNLNPLKLARRSIACKLTPLFAQQCRFLNLYLTAKSGDTNNYKIKDFERYHDYAKPEDVKLDIWMEKPLKHEKRTTLADVLENYLKSGTLLTPLITKGSKVGSDGQYMLKELDISKEKGLNILPKKLVGLKGRGAKGVHFKTSVPAQHFMNTMLKSWHQLRVKNNMEFHIHLKNSMAEKDRTKFDAELNHPNAIHLRPDVLLKAMGDTEVETIISPWANHRSQCAFVLAPRGEVDLSSNLQMTKKANDIVVMRRKQTLLELDAQGAGIPMKWERKRIKAEQKNSPEYKTHAEKRNEAFAKIRATDPAIEPVIRRLSEKHTPASVLLSMADNYQAQQQTLSRLGQEDPELFKVVRKAVKPQDSPIVVRKKISEAQAKLREPGFREQFLYKEERSKVLREKWGKKKADVISKAALVKRVQSSPNSEGDFDGWSDSPRRENGEVRVRFVGKGD
ncbi:hypothetical protein GLAREA_06371 [Glarea lozoyensis ATCC 20868]|uniref:Uncharacterized protein n=1 Tax=Glarea lozoyensis (strain ATCC 20868 / MF5171) TaxID=1116229 RepID=S3D8B2_GLAL2|nr:uncharacterized protein GLAREA_06371 [Glarea lozoyensis ATCC 20868]EPE33359.1 hypothetical protein GLAREA_06371 [Glarea lozoyensis ATCC 20868]